MEKGEGGRGLPVKLAVPGGCIALLGLAAGTFIADLGPAQAAVTIVAGIAGAVAGYAVGQSQRPEQQSLTVVQGAANAEQGLPVHPVTGLYTQWVVRDRLVEEVARAGRHKRNLALLLLEPNDPVMEINPSMFGQEYAKASRKLRKAMRNCDFVGQIDDARIVVVMPETGQTGAQLAGKRLLTAINAGEGKETGWIGCVVLFPADSDDANGLLAAALQKLRRRRSTPGRAQEAEEAKSRAA